MPVSVNNLQTLKTYVRGVLGSAKHHAPNVEEIVLALAGAVVSRMNAAPLEVQGTPKSGMGLALRFTSTRGRRYALSYDHATQSITLKQGSSQGPILHNFTNATPLSQIAQIFSSL
jgi:Integron cassette protein VCH_CASS1 chain